MRVAHRVEELAAGECVAAIGSFDGVHRGHRRVLETARAVGGPVTVVTFWPHPRLVLGNRVELLSTLERRIELFEDAGVDEVLVVEFTAELAAREPADFAESLLRQIGVGRAASGDAALLERHGFDVRSVPTLDGVSSTIIRGFLREGDVVGAARLLGRPPELEGTVVLGDRRGGTLGYPTANLAVPAELLVPAYGIYAGSALDHRAAISIGVNPHYGGDERRIEPHLLDFEGDLYGRRLVVELWQRLREERAFTSEEELVSQITYDVEETRRAERPS